MVDVLEKIGQIQEASKSEIKPTSWYQGQIRQLGLNTINTQKMIQSGKLTTRVIPGYMYLFKYDPKDKDLQWKIKRPGEKKYTLTNTMPFKQDSNKVGYNSSNVNKVEKKYGVNTTQKIKIFHIMICFL